MDDLISIGSIGLVKGISTFSAAKGTTLATYLARCIENEILMTLRTNKRYKNTVYLQEQMNVDSDGNELTLMDVLSVKEDSIFKQVEMSIVSDKLDKIMQSAVKTGVFHTGHAFRLEGRHAVDAAANGKGVGHKPLLCFKNRNQSAEQNPRQTQQRGFSPRLKNKAACVSR